MYATILIEECLKNFKVLQQLCTTNQELVEIYVDISRALEDTIFTDEELGVLFYVTNGYSFSDISKIMNISVRIVPTHFANICNKMEETLGNNYTTDLKGEINDET